MAASAYHVISKEVENEIFRYNWFFRHMYVWAIQMCKYYIVISDTLLGSFLDGLFLLFAAILSELSWETKKKDWVTEKST